MTAVTAIIPARGGSRRVPRKNLQGVAGKPMISWTIRAALGARSVDRVIVTTDDEEIAAVSREYGADVPFLRPSGLATDSADSIAVVTHALQFLEARGQLPAVVALLQPTSPLREAGDIDGAAALYHEKQARAVVSVSRVERPAQWLRRMGADGELLPYLEGDLELRQDGEPLFELNGAMYLIGADTFIREQTFFPRGTLAYVMPPERSIDIDTPWDLRLADLIMRDSHAA